MKIRKILLSLTLSGAMVLGLMPGMRMTAQADEVETSYILTIPSTLTVADKGWNATTDGISATGTLADGKKLTVTASSANNWALKQQDGNETVSYTMKETADGAAKTAWEFTTLPGSATLGIDVADYSSKPAGIYQDTVTFTAKVESASTPVTAITINKTATTIQVGNNETLSVTAVTPDNATDQTVTWSSDKETVATVNATTGEVTAVAVGTANITATAGDGSGVTATCAVTVAPLYYDKAVQVYRSGSPEYRDYVYSGNYKTLSADEGYALAQYFASVNSCSVCVITDWINSNGQMKYVTNSSSAEQQSVPSFFGRYDRVYLVPKN